MSRRRSFRGPVSTVEHTKKEKEGVTSGERDRRGPGWKGCTRALDVDLEGMERTQG